MKIWQPEVVTQHRKGYRITLSSICIVWPQWYLLFYLFWFFEIVCLHSTDTPGTHLCRPAPPWTCRNSYDSATRVLGFKVSSTIPAVGYNFLRFSNEDLKERHILGANISISKIDSWTSLWSTWSRQFKQRHRDPQNSAQAGRPPTAIFPFQTLLLINYWFLP